LILQHHPECRQTGTQTLPGYQINRWTDGAKPFGGGAGHAYESETTSDESCPIYACDVDCAVRKLGPQNEDKNTVARFFKQMETTMETDLPQELLSYLTTLVSPPEKYNPNVIVTMDFSTVDFSSYQDESVHGVVAVGDPTDYMEEVHRVLKPGGHLLLISEQDQLNFKAVCNVEDFGYEVRDSICYLNSGEDRFCYTAKAAKSERNAGVKTGNIHPCLHPNALVMTPFGYRPISKIEVGDKVYSADGGFHSVTDVSRHQYTSPDLFEIKVMGTNYSTLASDNHPFLIYRPTRKRNAITGGEVLWLRADQIQKGDYTMTPKLAEPPPTLQEHDLNWWFVFGLWVAEGVAQCAGHGENVYPSFSLHEKETHLIDCIKKAFPEVKTSVYQKGGKGIQVMAFDKTGGKKFVELGGRGAAYKQLDPLVWTLPKEVRRAILDGYIAGDGGKVRSYLQAKTVSPDLASQMRLLASSVGYKANLFTYPPEPGKIGNRVFKSTRRSYQVRLYSSNAKNLKQGSRKPSRPFETVHEGVAFVMTYVKSVVRVPYGGEVVNLSVEGSPTFQTAVGMSHNTCKPIAIMKYLLEDVPEGALVCDPFLGSGTTGVACLQTGHDFIGIEREEEYVRIAHDRITHWNNENALQLGANVATIKSDVGTGAGAEEDRLEDELDGLFG